MFTGHQKFAGIAVANMNDSFSQQPGPGHMQSCTSEAASLGSLTQKVCAAPVYATQLLVVLCT